MVKLTEQRARDRRDTIIEAAATLFAQRGFAETSMAEIVEASGVATGTVYRYFANKDAVVMAVSEAVIGVRFDLDDGGPVSLPEALKILIDAATNQLHGQLSAQVCAKATGSPQLRSLIAERHARVCRWLARAIDQVHGEPSTAAVLRAELIICAVTGLQQRLASGVKIDLGAFRDGLFALVDCPPPKP